MIRFALFSFDGLGASNSLAEAVYSSKVKKSKVSVGMRCREISVRDCRSRYRVM